MRLIVNMMLATTCGLVWAKQPESPRVSEPVIYSGMCGASAAAPVDNELFIAADDEGNQLRVFRRDQGGPPVQVTDLTRDLALDRRAPETDIEGAARVGGRVYWITSHSRNASGKEHPNRYRFFATSVRHTGARVEVALEGRPYERLLADLVAAPSLSALKLKTASRLAPKKPGALNIEGLCGSPENHLLIGFRNPVPGGNALLVPLLNPQDLLEGKSARFGAPILLDLEGLGIRDIGFAQGRYLIIAGPYDSGGKSKLFSWPGPGAKPKHLKNVDLKGLNPEALILYPDVGSERVQLLSDDSRRQGELECKDVPAAARQFRSVWVSLTRENKGKAPGVSLGDDQTISIASP